jgi:hypothetical protein
MSGIVLAWLIGEGIIVTRSVSSAHHPPIPGQLLGSSGFFALLALIAEYPPARPAATLIAFGIDIAAFLSPSWTTPWLTPASTSGGVPGLGNIAPTPSGRRPAPLGQMPSP